MDSELNTTENDYLSEYEEAVARFGKTIEVSEQSTRSNNNPKLWDEIIKKLCRGDIDFIETGGDSTLFYHVVQHADFLQIKDSFTPKFYAELCRCFILTDMIDDIVENIHRLDNIAHVKISIVQGFLMELQILPIIEDGWLLLKHSEEKKWTEITRSVACNLRVYPSGWKLFFTNRKFKVIHLNFLLRLLEVRNLSLQGCSFIRINTSELFKNLNLTSLNLKQCGMEVNKIIHENIPGVFQNLNHLNISKNPFYERTLLKLSILPIQTLNIQNNMENGPLIQSIVFQGIILLKESDEAVDLNISVLLCRNGRIGDSLQELDMSYNYLTVVNVEKISQLNLTKLDITRCFEYIANPRFSRISFPSSFKQIKALKNIFSSEYIVKICPTNLKNCARDSDDFFRVNDSSLAQSSRELTRFLHQSPESSISFISKFEKTIFKCNFPNQSLNTDIIEEFIKNYSEEPQLHEKLNLIEIFITWDCTFGSFKPILLCVKHHESLVKLKLDQQQIEDCALVESRNSRKKLRTSRFVIQTIWFEKYFKEVIEMKSLKKFKLSEFITEILNVNMTS